MSRTGEQLRVLLDSFRRWQLITDPGSLFVTLGAYAANKLPGEPFWFLDVAPPSNGKTERLSPITGLPDVYETATLTEAALLSGIPPKEWTEGAKGGLLREIDKFGVILCKDFTSVLSMRRDRRTEVIAALREVYDGRYTRRVGSAGGLSLSWEGKVGLLAACTPIIDSHHAVIGALGERFLIHRPSPENPQAVARKALESSGDEGRFRAEARESVRAFVRALHFPAEPLPLSDTDIDRLSALSEYVALARGPVLRDGYRREIEQIPGAEGPPRIAKCLAQFLRGLRVIGVGEEESWRLVERVALDSLPGDRRAVLVQVVFGNNRVASIEERPGLSHTTVRRALEDLEIYGILRRKPGVIGELWVETDSSSSLRTRAFRSLSEMSPPSCEGPPAATSSETSSPASDEHVPEVSPTQEVASISVSEKSPSSVFPIGTSGDSTGGNGSETPPPKLSSGTASALPDEGQGGVPSVTGSPQFREQSTGESPAKAVSQERPWGTLNLTHPAKHRGARSGRRDRSSSRRCPRRPG